MSEVQEKILIENPNRFVLFPIEHDDIWKWYKQSQACIWTAEAVSYTHLRAHETRGNLVCRLLLEKKK